MTPLKNGWRLVRGPKAMDMGAFGREDGLLVVVGRMSVDLIRPRGGLSAEEQLVFRDQLVSEVCRAFAWFPPAEFLFAPVEPSDAEIGSALIYVDSTVPPFGGE